MAVTLTTFPTVRGPLRAGRRTKDLVKRLRPGDVALIHHEDLDAMAARALVECRVAAVVNAAHSVSGRYPNGGPGVLLDAGIPVVDGVGEEFFARASAEVSAIAEIDERTVRLVGAGSGLCGAGERLTRDSLDVQLEAARANLGAELDRFARNTLEYLAEEKALLFDPVDVPETRTPIRGRHVAIVVRGEGYKEDLRSIGEYLRDVRPVLIGVDGGADALLEVGLRPDLIVGDMDSVSDRALKSGAELVVHAYAKGDGRAPGLERIETLGLKAAVFRSPGTSEDIAMILADQKGASLIVAVGTHFSLEEFLDKGRRGMASTFLVRLRIGSKMVDAKGITRLWSQMNRPVGRDVVWIIGAALFPILIIGLYSPWVRTVLKTAWLAAKSALHWR